MSHENCLFCKIASGEIPSTKVHEDEEFLAFYDIRPAAQTHVLVIPRRHIATLSDCVESDAPLLGRMMVLAARLAEKLGCSYTGGETGFRTVINTGPGGGQEVYHLHAHLLAGPRPWLRMG
ncbi:MAG TPA: histidine triad nucleotide-binding protein [Trinickia sp.]|jgi:histidine triad (HIT) family protein|uniref:histidine triad nucleotide-binding protein n=1 Tax=Trinickia sp. TaxID=2571163 RepID=UPI002D00F0DB|nr:histidine triad nucleotide-binding protein [Trinickia sp.]HTI16147.1 histidine triad nucleotide-binding protein [Trinickia sp.]